MASSITFSEGYEFLPANIKFYLENKRSSNSWRNNAYRTNGKLNKNQKIRFMAAGATHTIDRVGIFSPKPIEVDYLGPGEIGFINSGIKSVSDCKVGDTITEEKNPTKVPLPGFKPSQPVVFCGMFPVDSDDYEHLRDSMVKFCLLYTSPSPRD